MTFAEIKEKFEAELIHLGALAKAPLLKLLHDAHLAGSNSGYVTGHDEGYEAGHDEGYSLAFHEAAHTGSLVDTTPPAIAPVVAVPPPAPVEPVAEPVDLSETDTKEG